MNNWEFRFKQFKIRHRDSAMKVGTDGVLLGAWTRLPMSGSVLDVGTGCGLIALMMAQRGPDLKIHSIEKEKLACEEAKYNITNSPWKDRVTVRCVNFLNFASELQDTTFNLIVSNPPFFENATKPKGDERSMARVSDDLSAAILIRNAAKILTSDGNLVLIIPIENYLELITLARDCNWHVHEELHVKPIPKGPVKRVLIRFGLSAPLKTNSSELIIEEFGRHRYSENYIKLCKAYFLDM